VLSWPGQLETYIPLHDTGGYDRARAPLGSYDWRLDQVKGTARLHPGNQVQVAFGTPALHPRRQVDFTFLYYDLRTRELLDPAWIVPSLKLDEVCVPQKGSEGRRVFTARRSGLTRDVAALYQVAIRELAAARGWSLLPSKSSLAGVSTNPIETGAFFERHFDAAFLEVATGDEVLMAATPDNFGRHRLAFSKQTGRWGSIAIHGSDRDQFHPVDPGEHPCRNLLAESPPLHPDPALRPPARRVASLELVHPLNRFRPPRAWQGTLPHLHHHAQPDPRQSMDSLPRRHR